MFTVSLHVVLSVLNDLPSSEGLSELLLGTEPVGVIGDDCTVQETALVLV